MKFADLEKYKRDYSVDLPNRQWPSKRIEKAPIWCSVDLRDGNQSLAIPMNVEQKLMLFRTLLDVGFKEIEVGFPSASDTEYAFIRKIINEGLVPEGVSLQILTQSREHLIRKSFEALKGSKSAIVHLYNSTSALQRKVTFNKSRKEIIDIAKEGTKLVRDLADELEAQGTKVRMEYSPESFSDTELDFALEICEEVKSIWKPSVENKLIVNLPETVQYSSPNIHADQIEWMSTNISERDCVEISLHTHNDRGTGVAATELGLMAGADRVEGTLFGNGERTGNLDIVTVALNMFASGVDPELDFTDLPKIRQVYQESTGMEVPMRHPYAGDLVFTAFSGSHQDAIKKGMDLRAKGNIQAWEVPYLLIDPNDIGCSYEAIIRINSQSGKGGVSYVLDSEFGYDIPKAMAPELGNFVNMQADKKGKELSSNEIYQIFADEFIKKDSPIKLESYDVEFKSKELNEIEIHAKLLIDKKNIELKSIGNGPINALVNAFKENDIKDFKLLDYRSHAIGKGSATDSVAYVLLESLDGTRQAWGAGVDSSIESAGLKAFVCAYNRLLSK